MWRPLLPENVHNPFTRTPTCRKESVEVPADLVVFAVGMMPDGAPYHACIAPGIHNIGDSFHVCCVSDAIKAAHATSLAL